MSFFKYSEASEQTFLKDRNLIAGIVLRMVVNIFRVFCYCYPRLELCKVFQPIQVAPNEVIKCLIELRQLLEQREILAASLTFAKELVTFENVVLTISQ